MVALTGAGVSAESGIPTFRGKEGDVPADWRDTVRSLAQQASLLVIAGAPAAAVRPAIVDTLMERFPRA